VKGAVSMSANSDVLTNMDASSNAARRPLDRSECALIVIDIQEKLLPPIFEKDRFLRNA